LGAFVPATYARDEDDDEEDGDSNDEETRDGGVQYTGDDDEEDDDDFDEEPEPHEDVETSYLFPSHTNKEFPSGERIDLLFGFTNNADIEFNVTGVAGFLVAPQDFSYFIENYTAMAIGRIVGAGEQHTFQYAFQPNENFDPREFGFTAIVEYVDAQGQVFRSPIYNGTVSLVEPHDFTDSTTFFTYCAIAAVAGLAAFVVYRLFYSGKKSKRSSRPAPIERGTGSDKQMTEQEMEYLQGIIPGTGKKEKKSAKASTGKQSGSGKKGSQRA
jgi:translocon-associated protein subunit alpha